MAAAVVTTAARTKRTKFFLNCMVNVVKGVGWLTSKKLWYATTTVELRG